MARLSLSEADAKVRKWFIQETESLDCAVTVDQMGNIFAKRPGSLKPSEPMTAMGSHLDTQPRGGRYDGILGVLAGVEVLRTMHENNWKTNFDVGVVDWTNEEGARFPKSMCASGVWAGVTPIAEALSLPDIFNPSITLGSELEKHKYAGDMSCSSTTFPLGAHFELHIEQGPILESSSKTIGIVQGTQGYRWYTFTIAGRDAHTGITPFSARQDPLLAAAKMIAYSSTTAKALGGLASTGVIKIPRSSSTNTLPSSTIFTLDIRHPDDSVVYEIEKKCFKRFQEIASEDGKGVDLTWTIDTDSPAVRFHPDCLNAVKTAAIDLVGEDGCMEITSGAGHDSIYTNRHCPTAIIFVPCKNGVSHHPEEYCSPFDW
ncbi:MAG: hypothetical protein M1834_000680 [Cirrosporium novae-zelandiae]|nr:MAG: hypothetical protein M1834_000680 [Cirrosporium novae-zelandiae]